MPVGDVAPLESGQLWTASVSRSLWAGRLLRVIHQGGTEEVVLWWGPIVRAEHGDELVMLPTPNGSGGVRYVVEAVVKKELE